MRWFCSARKCKGGVWLCVSVGILCRRMEVLPWWLWLVLVGCCDECFLKMMLSECECRLYDFVDTKKNEREERRCYSIRVVVVMVRL